MTDRYRLSWQTTVTDHRYLTIDPPRGDEDTAVEVLSEVRAALIAYGYGNVKLTRRTTTTTAEVEIP